jgi:Skp family chaperone for outer membrane proteins
MASTTCLVLAGIALMFCWQNFHIAAAFMRTQVLLEHHKFEEAKAVNRQLEEETQGPNLQLVALGYNIKVLEANRHEDADASLQFAVSRLQTEKPVDLIVLANLQKLQASTLRTEHQLAKAEAAFKAAIQTVIEAQKTGVPTSEPYTIWPMPLMTNLDPARLAPLSSVQLGLLGVYAQEGKFEDAARLANDMLANKDQLKLDKDDLARVKKLQLDIAAKHKPELDVQTRHSNAVNSGNI